MVRFLHAPERYLQIMRDAIPRYDRLQDEVVAAVTGVTATRILDLGVGTGETARRCLEVHPAATVMAIDASQDMLDVAAGVLDERTTLRRARLEEPLPPGPFDLVVSALAVHHLDGPGKADLFHRIRARLAPGGRFVMADVVIPAAPVAEPTPLVVAVDRPDRLDDILAWLRLAGLAPTVGWTEQDLVVVVCETAEREIPG